MKKIIVAISMLLIATLALSVSAFGAPADYGVKTYYLGSPVAYAPTVDGIMGASEYITSYVLNEAAIYVDSTVGALSSNKPLDKPATSTAVTTSMKVGLSYDVDYIYVGIQTSLGTGVSDVTYTVELDGVAYTLSPDFDDSKVNYKSESKLSGNLFVGELAIVNNSISAALTVDDTYELKITELTKDNKDNALNKSIWNAVKLNSIQKYELNTTADYIVHSFVLNSQSYVKPAVSVSQEPIGIPTVPGTTEVPTTEVPTTEPATTEPVTTEPVTTEPATTEPATTEPATTEPATTEPATTQPAATEPATTEPAPEKDCKNSIGLMGIALVATLGTCAVVATKKKED